MRRSLGMSLLEVTMAVGVVALVASVAVPSMDAYLNRGKAARAVGDIGTISIQLYRWQSNTRKFPSTLAEAGLSNFVDPWGNPYQYVNVASAKPGDVRHDRNGTPLNSDFDLYSLGPDGRTDARLDQGKGRDDIVRANNGQFVGVAQDLKR
jgi:general secretion pathway protein G